MRMFETVTSSALVIAAQALVVGVIISPSDPTARPPLSRGARQGVGDPG